MRQWIWMLEKKFEPFLQYVLDSDLEDLSYQETLSQLRYIDAYLRRLNVSEKDARAWPTYERINNMTAGALAYIGEKRHEQN